MFLVLQCPHSPSILYRRTDNRDDTTEDLQQATSFKAVVRDGQMLVEPHLPRGEWEPREIQYHLIGEPVCHRQAGMQVSHGAST